MACSSERVIILCSTTADATLRFRKKSEISSARRQNQSILLNWERVSRSMPVVKLLSIATTNARAPWPVRVYKDLSPAQATMLDPIQMGLRNTRLGCSRFMIEHRSLPIRSPSRNQCDPDFSVRTVAIRHQRYQLFVCKEPM